MKFTELSQRAREIHLSVLGVLTEANESIVLLGPAEPGFWTNFTSAPEYLDGSEHPLDRWSRRIITQLAKDCGGTAVFPFDGPPYAPFQQWALASGRAWVSPIGMLVHDTAGLMVSYRGALKLALEDPPRPRSTNPCLACNAPCRSACPVNAFAREAYDVIACRSHIADDAGAECLSSGCLARRACPVSQTYGRAAEQSGFHMRAFLDA